LEPAQVEINQGLSKPVRLDVPHVARNCDLLWFWNIILPIQITNWEPTPQFEVDIEVQIAPCANVGQELLGIQPDEKVRVVRHPSPWHLQDAPRHWLQGIPGWWFQTWDPYSPSSMGYIWDIYIWGIYNNI